MENKELDKELMQIYIKGFSDELNGVIDKTSIYKAKAYELGVLHAMVGDNTEKIDAMSETDILNEIKKNKL